MMSFLCDQLGQIEAQGGDIGGQILRPLLKADKNARLAELGGPAHQELQGQERFARARAAADQGGPAGGQAPAGDFIQPCQSRWAFVQRCRRRWPHRLLIWTTAHEISPNPFAFRSTGWRVALLSQGSNGLSTTRRR